MAILKNRQSVNPLEYERQLAKLYHESRDRISHIPRRRWKYVAEPLLECLNTAYISIMGITYDPVRGRDDYAQIKYDRIQKGIASLLAMQKPLYVYWAISNDRQETAMRPRTDDQRKAWADQTNHVLNLLAALARSSQCYNPDDDIPPNPIRYYTNAEVRNSLLLRAARSLLLETQRRVISLPLATRDADGMILEQLMADIWYHANEANARIPRTAEEYRRRRDHLSALISDITKANRPMLAVFATGTISEANMAKMATLLSETNDLAYRIMTSDRKRFGSLM